MIKFDNWRNPLFQKDVWCCAATTNQSAGGSKMLPSSCKSWGSTASRPATSSPGGWVREEWVRDDKVVGGWDSSGEWDLVVDCSMGSNKCHKNCSQWTFFVRKNSRRVLVKYSRPLWCLSKNICSPGVWGTNTSLTRRSLLSISMFFLKVGAWWKSCIIYTSCEKFSNLDSP